MDAAADPEFELNLYLVSNGHRDAYLFEGDYDQAHKNALKKYDVAALEVEPGKTLVYQKGSRAAARTTRETVLNPTALGRLLGYSCSPADIMSSKDRVKISLFFGTVHAFTQVCLRESAARVEEELQEKFKAAAVELNKVFTVKKQAI